MPTALHLDCLEKLNRPQDGGLAAQAPEDADLAALWLDLGGGD